MKGVVPGEERRKGNPYLDLWERHWNKCKFSFSTLVIHLKDVSGQLSLVSHRGGGLCAVEGDWGWMHGWRLCPAPDPAALATVEKMDFLLPWSTVNCVLRTGDYPFIPWLVQGPSFVHSTPLLLGQSTLTIPLPILDCSGEVAEGFRNKLAPWDHGSPISTFSYSPSLATVQNNLPRIDCQ